MVAPTDPTVEPARLTDNYQKKKLALLLQLRGAELDSATMFRELTFCGFVYAPTVNVLHI